MRSNTRSSFVFSVMMAATMLLASGCAADVEDDEELDTTSSLAKKKNNNKNNKRKNKNKESDFVPPPTDPADVPPDCLGYFEREPDPRRGGEKLRGGKVCGELSPGDVDKFEFDVRKKNNAFTVRVEAEQWVQLRVHSNCTGNQYAEGQFVQLRVKPNDDCTVRVSVTSTSPDKQIYRLYKTQ